VKPITGPFIGRREESVMLARKINEVIEEVNKLAEKAEHPLYAAVSYYKPETVQERMQRALAEKPSYEDIERIMASSLKAALASEEASPRFIVREKLDPLAIIAPTLAMGEAAARDMRLADRDYHVISSPSQIKGRLVRGFVVIERDLILNFSAIMQALRPALPR
jgi:hypothetical protein